MGFISLYFIGINTSVNIYFCLITFCLETHSSARCSTSILWITLNSLSLFSSDTASGSPEDPELGAAPQRF